MKALSYTSLILFSAVWMLAGCVQGTPRSGQGTPSSTLPDTAVGTDGGYSHGVGAPGTPHDTLTFLARAVDARDFNAVQAAFAPPYRAALQQWSDSSGVDSVMQTLAAGLRATRDASPVYAVVRHTGNGQIRWEDRVASWEAAQPLALAAKADRSVSRVEIEYRGLVFGLYGSAWLLERW